MPLSGLRPAPVLQRRDGPGDIDDLAHKKQAVKAIDAIANGAVNWVVEFELVAGGGTTTVEAINLTPDSQISLQPLDATAAALLPQLYIDLAGMIPGSAWSGQQTGSFNISHPLLVLGTVATYRASIKG